jgi:guanine nucleotide-binding protein subunit alpha, other
LTGAGESGKSTVLKQMRIMHTGGFSKMERMQWRVIIFSNLVNAFQILLAAMEEQDTDFEDEDNYVRSAIDLSAQSSN